MRPYLTILRPVNGVMSAVAVYIGSILVGGPALPSLFGLLAMFIVFLISGGGMIVNDIFDMETDKINRPNRPLPSGKISVRGAYIYSVVIFLLGNALAFIYLNANAFYLTAVATLLLIAYNSKLKKVMIAGHISVSALVALTFIYGGVAQSNAYSVIVPFASLAFLANMGREIFKTIEDALGDKHSNIETIAVRYGVFRAKILGSLFVISGIAMSVFPYIWGLADVVYLGIVIIADVIFVAAIAVPMKHSSRFVKIGMNVALLAFMLGAWSMQGLF